MCSVFGMSRALINMQLKRETQSHIWLCCNRYTDQAYWVKATNKRDQLLEVLASFDIEVKEGSLLSRCAKCNGTFIPR